MNKKIFSLTKVLLKNSFQRYDNKKQKNKVATAILYIIVFGYVMALFGVFSFQIINTLKQINQESIFIGMFLMGVALFIIIQGMVSATNVFYFSRDLEYILPLPLKPREILISKLNVILITEYIVELLFAVVPIIIYGVLTAVGIQYYIISFLVLLIFPIIPLIISTIIIMIIMSFTKGAKNKDRFQLIVPILGIILAFAISFASTGSSDISEKEVLEKLLQANQMVELISDKFIILKPAINAIINSDILELLKLAIITIIGYLAFILIGSKIYFRGAIGNLSSGNKTKKKIKINSIKTRKIGKTYVIKEIKILFRNPIFFVQCVLPSVFMPILVLGIAIFTISSNESNDLQAITSILGSLVQSPIGMAVIIAVTEFMYSMLYIAPTAISRDGSNAIFMKYIPVSYYKQIIYKGIPNVIFGTITSIIILIFVYLVMRVSFVFLAICFVINLILIIIQTLLMELVDLKKPKLDWSTEYAVVKQNLNLLWPFVVGLLEIMVAFVIAIPLKNNSYFVFAGIFTIIHIIITYFINRYIYKKQNELFDKIM